MFLGFLPLEKIPIFIWALPLIIVGGYLLLHEDFYSWGQIRAMLIIVVGVCAFVYDVRKRHLAKLKTQVKSD